MVLASAGGKVTSGVTFTPTVDDGIFHWRSDFSIVPVYGTLLSPFAFLVFELHTGM